MYIHIYIFICIYIGVCKYSAFDRITGRLMVRSLDLWNQFDLSEYTCMQSDSLQIQRRTESPAVFMELR